MEDEVGSKSKRYVEIFEKINTNVPFSEVLSQNKKLEDHENGEIIDVKRGRLAFEVRNERIKVKPEQVILMVEPKPPP